MDFFPRRPVLLTREEILGSIASSVVDGTYREIFGGGRGGSGPSPDAPSEIGAPDESAGPLDLAPDERTVARGILAQQAALDQALQILENKLGRALTANEKTKICQALPPLLQPGGSSAIDAPQIRGPRISRDAWGH